MNPDQQRQFIIDLHNILQLASIGYQANEKSLTEDQKKSVNISYQNLSSLLNNMKQQSEQAAIQQAQMQAQQQIANGIEPTIVHCVEIND
jgi:hypothetical protein